MIYAIAGLAAIWIGSAVLVCAGWWHASTQDHTDTPRCACGQHTLDDCEAVWTRDILHEADRCQPTREQV